MRIMYKVSGGDITEVIVEKETKKLVWINGIEWLKGPYPNRRYSLNCEVYPTKEEAIRAVLDRFQGFVNKHKENINRYQAYLFFETRSLKDAESELNELKRKYLGELK